MKKIAVVIDFDSKILKENNPSSKYDLFIIDRLNDHIANVEANVNDLIFSQDLTFEQFYKILANEYKEVICLFLSYDYSDVSDYIMTQKLNQNRQENEAKIYTYLLNYMVQNKQDILANTVDMIEKEYKIRDIIVRNHNIRKKEVFSLSDLMTRYITKLF